MIAGVGFDPGLVVGGAPAQDLLADRRNTDHVAEEVHHLRGPRQAAEVTVNDNAVKAVVDKSEQVTEQQGEQFHGSAPGPARGRKTIRRGPGQQIVAGQDFRLADEVRYIQRHAANHHGRLVTIGQLVLFPPEPGDAGLLDRAARLAARLARDGDSEPIHIEDTDTTFAIGWKGRYRIEGTAFVYSDNDSGRVTTILGYPTDQLARIG